MLYLWKLSTGIYTQRVEIEESARQVDLRGKRPHELLISDKEHQELKAFPDYEKRMSALFNGLEPGGKVKLTPSYPQVVYHPGIQKKTGAASIS